MRFFFLEKGWVAGRKVNVDKIKRKTDSISVDTVIGYRNSGYTWQEVAKTLNIGRNTLIRFRERNNLEG